MRCAPWACTQAHQPPGPWQNGGIGSCRRELLDHVIPLHEQHLRRLIGDFVPYSHADRIHDGLGKDTPNRRAVENRPSSGAKAISFPRLGGLHHLRLATSRLTRRPARRTHSGAPVEERIARHRGSAKMRHGCFSFRDSGRLPTRRLEIERPQTLLQDSSRHRSQAGFNSGYTQHEALPKKPLD